MPEKITVDDLVLWPHCDMHLVLEGTPPELPEPPRLMLKVFHRQPDPEHPDEYALNDVTADCTYEFFAPYETVGTRLDDLPTVDPHSGEVSAIKQGVFLLQIRFQDYYQIARLQVHRRILDWWFGNDSVTTAKDDGIAHAQPSIYARFSDDPARTDLIGDITGHGYVQLNPSDANVVTIDDRTGRLRGVQATDKTPTENLPKITGRLLGLAKDLTVRVVDYAVIRRDLVAVHAPHLSSDFDQHNIVFLAEGYRDTKADRDAFDELVTKVNDELFHKPRHEPYGMLEGSFDVYKAFAPSQQHALTCGYQVTDNADGLLGKGVPIPANRPVSQDKNVYGIGELIAQVGPALRNETTPNPALIALWSEQSLPTSFKAARVDDVLINEWKAHRSTGILNARDTFFGLHLGNRWADRRSNRGTPVVRPATDAPGADLTRFIARLYEFWRVEPFQLITPDPRRHPPELSAGWPYTNRLISIMNYAGGLQLGVSPFPLIGTSWTPFDSGFRASRGLVVLLVQDTMVGGAAFDNFTGTALTLDARQQLAADYDNPADPRVMHRKPPDTVKPNFGTVVDTAAHELGHVFNLFDEGEATDGDDPNATRTDDFTADNVTRLSAIRKAPASRQINIDLVKWSDIPRVRLSDRTTAQAATVNGSLLVSIDRNRIGDWEQARKDQAKVNVRPRGVARLDMTAHQLPLPGSLAKPPFLQDLEIHAVNPTTGTVTLTGVELPAGQIQIYDAGATIYVPLRDKAGLELFAVEKPVHDFLKDADHGHDSPLNRDTDHDHVNFKEDHPLDIDGFAAPCHDERLIGVYEGAVHWSGGNYRPAGACKMRDQLASGTDGEFCFVCKWLIVNRVDSGRHAFLSAKFFPKAKKNKS